MTANDSTQPNGGLLNKFRKAYRWYKEHNPSSETESDESNDEMESESDGRKTSDQEGTSSHGLKPQITSASMGSEFKEPQITSASMGSEFKKRLSMTKNDYLKVPTGDTDSPISHSFKVPTGDTDSPITHSRPGSDGKPKYAPIVYRRRSSVALTK